MNWCISMIGEPQGLVEAINDFRQRLGIESRRDFEEVQPAIVALLRNNFAEHPYVAPVLKLEVSGQSTFDKERGKRLQATCSIKLELLHSVLVRRVERP